MAQRRRGRFASNLFVSELRLVTAEPEASKSPAVNPFFGPDV
jgi:hypothetical protein